MPARAINASTMSAYFIALTARMTTYRRPLIDGNYLIFRRKSEYIEIMAYFLYDIIIMKTYFKQINGRHGLSRAGAEHSLSYGMKNDSYYLLHYMESASKL